MNNGILYEAVKSLRKYVTTLLSLNHDEAIKLDSSDWQICLYDIESSLTVIEKLVKDGKDE